MAQDQNGRISPDIKIPDAIHFQPRKFTEKRAEKVPDGPGLCDVCSKHFENLLLHMADQHRVKNVQRPYF
jgi:hypothetical protein